MHCYKEDYHSGKNHWKHLSESFRSYLKGKKILRVSFSKCGFKLKLRFSIGFKLNDSE